MVFSSIPAYLDSSNWHQQQTHQIIGSSNADTLLPPPPQPTGLQTPPPPQPYGVGGGAGSIRPGSMSEKARMANIQLPEMALKCPRCESTNTKFCYFNNYSLSQPRHFCKTCRRYWTRGGALRNVPVGGGCRRNKRSKSTRSKSPANRDGQVTSSSTSSMSTNSGAAMANILGLNPPHRFMSPLSQLTDNFTTDNLGLNYNGISTAPMAAITNHDMNFHGGGGMANLLSSGNIEPWRLQQQMQQFPFMGGFDSSMAGIYGSESGFIGENYNQNEVRPPPKFSSSMFSQMTSVKMEDHHNNNSELNLSRGLYGGGNQDQWNAAVATAAWTDLSSFNTSSTTNPL